MSKFIGADRHVREVIKSGFHYGQLVPGEPRVEPTMDDSPGLTVTSSTRKMFRRIIPSVLAAAAHHAERESVSVAEGIRGNRLSAAISDRR